MLEPHGLTNPTHGGLKSICLIYLIIAYLKELRKTQEIESMSEAELFEGLLYFYGFSFNYKTHFI
jgi:DNA polymerase sigma